MNQRLECDGCGECCRQKLVDVFEEDILRNSRIAEHMSALKEPGLDGEIGYLNCSSNGKCHFLDQNNRCSIYLTRPMVCVGFRAGSEACQEVRLGAGLPLLEPVDDEIASIIDRPYVSFSLSTFGGQIMSSETRRPIHEIRMGRIRAAIWANETQNGMRHNVTISRIYRDGEEWKDSGSFGRDDLPLVAKVMDFAHSWIYANGSSPASSTTVPVHADEPF
ncbi:MAG: YkgJ family cysteine cluster protein [Pirellulaceae bacterium]